MVKSSLDIIIATSLSVRVKKRAQKELAKAKQIGKEDNVIFNERACAGNGNP